MVHTFIVSNNSVDLQVFVGGKIEIKPMPHNSFCDATVHILAAVHQVLIKRRLIKTNNKDLEEIAVDYFKSHGFTMKEK